MSIEAGEQPLLISPDALARLMPMYLWLSLEGRIRAIGGTLSKLLPDTPLVGQDFVEHFRVRRPREVDSMAELTLLLGTRLHLHPRAHPETGFRGIAVPLAGDQGIIVNLSFGIEAAEAVRRHELTNADFSPTDLTVEMLYLSEAKTAVMDELHDLNRRLQLAKTAAEEQALTDTLTGLGNRRAMDQTVERLLQSGIPFGLMHIDLDFFKQVNDTFGHAAGDYVLQRVALVLRDEIRVGDAAARVGGDEFVLIFPGLTMVERMAVIASRIIERLSHPIEYYGKPCQIGTSIGMTLSVQYDKPRADRMLSDADRALYASKSSGRSRATAYSPRLDSPVPHPAEINDPPEQAPRAATPLRGSGAKG